MTPQPAPSRLSLPFLLSCTLPPTNFTDPACSFFKPLGQQLARSSSCSVNTSPTPGRHFLPRSRQPQQAPSLPSNFLWLPPPTILDPAVAAPVFLVQAACPRPRRTRLPGPSRAPASRSSSPHRSPGPSGARRVAHAPTRASADPQSRREPCQCTHGAEVSSAAYISSPMLPCYPHFALASLVSSSRRIAAPELPWPHRLASAPPCR